MRGLLDASLDPKDRLELGAQLELRSGICKKGECHRIVMALGWCLLGRDVVSHVSRTRLVKPGLLGLSITSAPQKPSCDVQNILW